MANWGPQYGGCPGYEGIRGIRDIRERWGLWRKATSLESLLQAYGYPVKRADLRLGTWTNI
eukprot:12546969-Alexandrium_andersonii.AAC.1